MKHIARKYGFDYSLCPLLASRKTPADKFNLYLLYAAALKDEVGWDMFAEPEKIRRNNVYIGSDSISESVSVSISFYSVASENQ